jgi:DNA-binding MarR family transcriptional regulator
MGRPNAKTAKRGRAALDLDRHVPYFFTNISIRLSRGASKTYLRKFGIGITEWRVIASLGAMPGCGANQICHAVGLDKSAVSRSLKTLEVLGYVELTEDPGDTRFQKIALTKEGSDLHDRVLQVALKREGILLSCLSPDEIEVLIVILRKMRVQVGIVNAYDPDESAKPKRTAPRKQKS